MKNAIIRIFSKICIEIHINAYFINVFKAICIYQFNHFIGHCNNSIYKISLNNLLADHNITVEPERLLQEVAIFADRTSITEEIVRLKSHIKQFKAIIASDQPVGRKLDFLIQEFNREANTIASKANDYTLAQIVVEIKAEIEKIREQIQNIE